MIREGPPLVGSGHVAQILNVGGRHKAASDQSVLEKVRDPRAIFCVTLAPRNHLNVMRIHQHQRELPFECGPYRSPKPPGSLHRDVSDPVLSQPTASCSSSAVMVLKLRTSCFYLPLFSSTKIHP